MALPYAKTTHRHQGRRKYQFRLAVARDGARLFGALGAVSLAFFAIGGFKVYNGAMGIPSTMKVRPFSVDKGADQLSVLLGELSQQLNTGQRSKTVESGVIVRADNIEKRPDETNPSEDVWLMNLVRQREAQGPVKFAPERDVEPIDYAPDQSPGEDIAVLYSTDTKHMLIQQTAHFRTTPVRDYLNAVYSEARGRVRGEALFVLTPVPNQAEIGKFAVANKIKMVHFKMDSRGIADADCDNNIALESSLRLRAGVDVRMDIKISAVHQGDDLGDVYRGLVNTLHKYAGKDVRFLKTRVTDPDEKTELINLVNPLVEASIPMNLDDGRVFPWDERYDELVKQYNQWKPMLKDNQPD